MNFCDVLKAHKPQSGSVSVFFMGQTGFIIKLADGTLIGLDLYLSDCCEREFGFKRIMPKILLPGEIEFDYLLFTHGHFDHFDIDSAKTLTAPEKTRCAAARDVEAPAVKAGADISKFTFMSVGDVFEGRGFTVRAVSCDHGKLSPDALGFLITICGKKIYITGDTAYREDYFADKALHGCDLLIMPINGAFGNMNEHEGAKAVKALAPKNAVPAHFWCFAEHGGNPAEFMRQMKELSPDSPYTLMQMGECISV